MAMNVTPTTHPDDKPRNKRRQEQRVHCVRWGEPSLGGIPTIYFRWFARDTAAVSFLNSLVDRGIAARLTSKP